MKRLLAAVLALAMCLGCMSFAAAEEKTKLTAVFIAHPLTQSVYDMEWLMEIEAEAGVDIEWEQIYTDWNQVKSTRFASGDIPDLLFNATGDSALWFRPLAGQRETAGALIWKKYQAFSPAVQLFIDLIRNLNGQSSLQRI